MKKLYLSKEFATDCSGQPYGQTYFFYRTEDMRKWVEIDPSHIDGFVDDDAEIGSDDPIMSVSFKDEKYQLIYQIGWFLALYKFDIVYF